MDVELIIDDVQVTAPEGASVLDAARRAGVDIPALCHHEAVPAIASCRLCLMEVRRPGRDWVQLTTSCDYPVSTGLVVVTDSPRIRKHRAMNLQLLLRRAPDAPALKLLSEELGVTEPLFAPVTDQPLADCILCELCVRVCSALGYNALAAIGRGDHKHIGPPFGQAAAMDCVGCGSCVEACPTDVHRHGGHGHHTDDLGPHLRAPRVRALRQADHDPGAGRSDGRRRGAAREDRRPLRRLQAARARRAAGFARKIRRRVRPAVDRLSRRPAALPRSPAASRQSRVRRRTARTRTALRGS